MKRIWTLLGVGLTLTLLLTACTRDKAPDVIPTPSPVVTSQPNIMSEDTPTTPNTITPIPEGAERPKSGGLTTRSTVRDAGGTAKDTAHDMDDVAHNVVDGAGDATKDIGNGVKRAAK